MIGRPVPLSEPTRSLARSTGVGATDGAHSLAITKPTSAWTWDARVVMSGDQLQAFQDALADNPDDYVLEVDVTYRAQELPARLTGLSMHVAIETNLDGWNQTAPHAAINGPSSQTLSVQLPLSVFGLSTGVASANLRIGFAGSFSGAAAGGSPGSNVPKPASLWMMVGAGMALRKGPKLGR